MAAEIEKSVVMKTGLSGSGGPAQGTVQRSEAAAEGLWTWSLVSCLYRTDPPGQGVQAEARQALVNRLPVQVLHPSTPSSVFSWYSQYSVTTLFISYFSENIIHI